MISENQPAKRFPVVRLTSAVHLQNGVRLAPEKRGRKSPFWQVQQLVSQHPPSVDSPSFFKKTRIDVFLRSHPLIESVFCPDVEPCLSGSHPADHLSEVFISP